MITIYVVMKDLKNQNRETRYSTYIYIFIIFLYIACIIDFFSFLRITNETLKLKIFRVKIMKFNFYITRKKRVEKGKKVFRELRNFTKKFAEFSDLRFANLKCRSQFIF